MVGLLRVTVLHSRGTQRIIRFGDAENKGMHLGVNVTKPAVYLVAGGIGHLYHPTDGYNLSR